MRVDDLPLGGVNHRVGNVAGPALREDRARQHGRGGAHVALATADERLVVQLVEAEARIGMNVPAVESAEAIDRDAAGAVLLHHRLLGQIHGGGGLQRLARHAFDLLRRLLPASATARALVLVGVLPGLVEFGERNMLDLECP